MDREADRYARKVSAHITSGVAMVDRFEDEWMSGGRRRVVIEYSVPVNIGDD